MLVLSRRKSEAIKIGEHIEVSILAIEGDQVKIGIDAPKAIDIFRKEVYVAIQQQNAEAANISLDVISQFTNKRNE